MSDQRPYKLTIGLTDKEHRKLAEYSTKRKMTRETVIIQALRLYNAVENGDVVLTPNSTSGAGF